MGTRVAHRTPSTEINDQQNPLEGAGNNSTSPFVEASISLSGVISIGVKTFPIPKYNNLIQTTL